MERVVDERCTDWQLSEALTSYCFGGLSDDERDAVEQHLLACDACWHEFERLDISVRTLRADAALRPTVHATEVVSLLGLSSRLDQPMAGHAAYVFAIAALFGLQWVAGLWTELGYAYARYGQMAWALSAPTGLWIAGGLVLALRDHVRDAKAGRTRGLLRSALVMLVAIVPLIVALVLVLPSEPTIVASFQTRTAAGGYLKDAIFHFIPLLIFILPPFNTVLRLQQELRAGRHRIVSRLLARHPDRLPPRGVVYLSPLFLVAVLSIMGIIKLAGMNYMLDALRPGPYAALFSAASYISTAIWFVIAISSLMWYQVTLAELKREAETLAVLDRPVAHRDD